MRYEDGKEEKLLESAKQEQRMRVYRRHLRYFVQ